MLRVKRFGQSVVSLVAASHLLGRGLAVCRMLSIENACFDFENDDEIFKQTTLDSTLDECLFMYVTN